MLNEPENRGDLIKGILAGGLVLVGLATGSNPLFTLLISTSVGVGGSLLGNIAEKSFENWHKSWFSSEGVLNDHIKVALMQAFADAIRQLEIDWKKNNDYHHLIYKKQHERAKLSLTLLHEMRDDISKLFQGEGYLAEASKQENIIKFLGEDRLEEGSARRLLNQTLDKYLGTVEPLAEFAKTHLVEQWLFRFGEILKSEDGTPAWRAYQQLWQSQLLQSTTQIAQSTFHSQEDVAQLRQEVGKISMWLEDWGKHLETDSMGKYNETILKSFDEIMKQQLEVYKNKLDSIKADTQLIINLLNGKFMDLDFDKIMINFLQKELLNDQYVNLKQAGHNSEEDAVSLGKVFVDLPVSNERSIDPPEEKSSTEGLPPGIVAQILNAANEHFDPESLSIQSDQTQTEQMPLPSKYKRGRFVVIGGPGQGKTTLSQFICQLFRAAILDNKLEIYYERVRGTLNEIKTLCSEEKIELPSIPRFPFRIILSDFAAMLASDKSINSLLSYIVDRIRTRTNQEITTDHLRHWLTEYPWIIILDGLDEVPASSNRDAVLSAIDHFWIDAAGCNADVLVVATTRPQGFNDDFAPNIYQHKWLSPLSQKRAMHFANRLVTVRYSKDQDRAKKIIERLQSAINDEGTARLMRSPLQITIMTALVDRIGKPPQERWSLFQRYYSVIYHRETERDIPAASILRNYEPDINAIHYRVGLLLQIESEFSGRTGVRLSHDRFAALVEARLEEEGHEGKDLEDLKQKIIEAATDRLVFLVGVEANEIGFEIRSLQEFMAAEALMGASDDLLQKRLRQIAPVMNWRNVFLFAAGKCFALEDRQHLRETIRGICAELNESEKVEDEVFHATLAGSELALDLLEDGPAQRQPKYAKSLARLACRLWNLPPNKNDTRLANLYENQLEDVYIQELEARLGDARIRQGPWQSLIYLSNKHIPWAEKLINTHWPNREAELLDLLQLSTKTGIMDWPIEKFSDLFSRLTPNDLFISLQQFRQMAVNDRKIFDQPKWLNSFLYPPSAVALPLQLPGTSKIDEAFNLHFLGNGKSEWIRSFAEMSNPTMDWLPFISAAKIAENTNKTILASAIRNIAEHCTIESIKWAANQLPWVLGTLLETVESKEELNVLADRVENGDFGDTEVWNDAETRWMTQGILENDLDYMNDEHWPFDQNIGHVGIPLSCLSMSAFSKSLTPLTVGEPLLTMPYKNLFALFRKYRGTKSGSQLATSIAWSILIDKYFSHQGLFLSGHKEREEKSSPINFSQFQEIIRESRKDLKVIIDCLPFFEWENLNNDEYFDFIDYLGKESKYFILRFVSIEKSDNELAKSFAEAFIVNPKRLGILNVLSGMAMSGHDFSIPQFLLQQEKYSDKRSREAVLIIRLSQQDWNQIEGKALARYTLKLAQDEPEIIDRILKTIDANRIVGLSLEAFLLELLNNIPNLDWANKMEILDALENSLRHRTSHLTEMWEELGLPISLKRLIQT